MPRIARVALNLLGGHDGIHDALMVILKRMMLHDRILLQTLHKNALMKHSNVKGGSEGRSIVPPSWLLVAAVLWHRKGGIWSSAFTRHRDMAMILGTCVSSNQSCLVESIVSCWWQFVIDIIVQVRCH